MESPGKQESISPIRISPEKTNSSAENNDHRQEQVKEDSATAATTPAAPKRSYECTFCKRGFTNAQALGGHMNIHRKDRAKAKQVNSSGSSPTSTSPKINQDYSNHMNPNFRVNSSEPMNYYPVFENPRNYTVYFPCPNRSENQRIPSSTNEELRGEVLSLRVGSNCEDNIEPNREVSKEEELDLELRLGHDPN